MRLPLGLRRFHGEKQEHSDDQWSYHESQFTSVLVELLSECVARRTAQRVQFRLGAHKTAPVKKRPIHADSKTIIVVN